MPCLTVNGIVIKTINVQYTYIVYIKSITISGRLSVGRSNKFKLTTANYKHYIKMYPFSIIAVGFPWLVTVWVFDKI